MVCAASNEKPRSTGFFYLLFFRVFAYADDLTALEMPTFGANGMLQAHFAAIAALNQVDRL